MFLCQWNRYGEESSWKRALNANPLPKLDNLITLKMIDLPNSFQNGLLDANRHVQSFSVDTNLQRLSECLPVPLANITLDDLQEFALNLVDERDYNALKSLFWPAVNLTVYYVVYQLSLR